MTDGGIVRVIHLRSDDVLLSEVKENMHKSVIFDGSVYEMRSCVLWLDEKANQFKYSLVLLDKNKNSVVDVPIEKVKVFENE